MKQVLKASVAVSGLRSVGAQRGSVIVEFALMLPLLAFLFILIVNFGLIIREHLVLQNAVREAARYSSLPASQLGPQNPSATEGNIKARVIQYCLNEGITVLPENIVVVQNYPISVSGGITVRASRITATYRRRFLIPALGPLPWSDVELSGSAVFSNLY